MDLSNVIFGDSKRNNISGVIKFVPINFANIEIDLPKTERVNIGEIARGANSRNALFKLDDIPYSKIETYYKNTNIENVVVDSNGINTMIPMLKVKHDSTKKGLFKEICV